ncbi:MAG: Cell division protein DedD [Burkholderia plantarii]|nr:MAG: Cell division protein DedD [Burkholderia plantarii]
MGIFSFGKKDDDAPPRRGSRSGSRSGRNERAERVERRTRRAERPADAMMLDPTLPEKQRARRRLVGAIALVIAAVIVLPMVLDSHPKPVTDDIAIDIPTKPARPGPARNDDAADTQAGVAHDEVPASDGSLADASAASTAPAASQGTAAAALAKPAAPAAQAPRAPVTARRSAPAVPATPAAPARQQAAADAPASPATPAGARFVLQLGALPDDATARSVVNKLKSAGVPAYVEHRKQPDGSTSTLLRAGPFADRAAASAAIAKVRDAGLSQ